MAIMIKRIISEEYLSYSCKDNLRAIKIHLMHKIWGSSLGASKKEVLQFIRKNK